MRYQVIILLICGIRNSSQRSLSDNKCYDSQSFMTKDQRHVCCYNYEMIYDKCTECKNGTTTEPGGRCVSCKNNTFGHKCIKKCECNQFQRCDPEVGCILKKSTSKIHVSTTYAGTTKPSSLFSESVTEKETIVTGNGSLNDIRSSKADWIIYTLCITSCFFLTGFGHLVRSYRNRGSLEVRKINENVASEPLYVSDNNEGEKKPLTFVKTGSIHIHKTSNNETINFVFNDEAYNAAGNEDDEADYFDMYFTIGEDINPQAENQASQKDPNSCQVPVTVHQFIERSSLSHEDDTSNIYSNVYMPVQKDRKMNKQANKSHLSSDSKTVNDTTLPFFIPATFRSLQYWTSKCAGSEKTVDTCNAIDSYEEKLIKNERSKTF